MGKNSVLNTLEDTTARLTYLYVVRTVYGRDHCMTHYSHGIDFMGLRWDKHKCIAKTRPLICEVGSNHLQMCLWEDQGNILCRYIPL